MFFLIYGHGQEVVDHKARGKVLLTKGVNENKVGVRAWKAGREN